MASTNSDEVSIPSRVGNWWLGECLGSGFSGSIYSATHLHTRQVVALKLQDVAEECPTNRYESYFYPLLQGGVGMPRLWGSGVDGSWSWLAIDLLGSSLDSLFRKNKDVLDLRSVCCIAQQVISRLEFMHNRGILHRDIQLGNCVIGLPPNDKVIYMIDFGFSKQYLDPRTHRHIPSSNRRRDFLGNYWFSSVNVHCKRTVPSRRDDLEAVALMLIHLLTPGGLVWTRNGVPKNDTARRKLERQKQAALPEDLCRGLPSVFEEFLKYCRRLKFAECPDYEQWVDAFNDLAQEHGYPESDAFVWPPTKTQATVRVAVHEQPPQPRPTKAKEVDVENALGALAQLTLSPRPALGELDTNTPHQNVKESEEQKAQVDHSKKTIESESDGEPYNAQAKRLTKAASLAALAKKVPQATDNGTLSGVVMEFADVLRLSSSRSLTKEGFSFLDALYKQLADPSVYAIPIRTSRSRGQSSTDDPEVLDRHGKMNRLLELRTNVGKATSNKVLARAVSEFGGIIDKSNGRTVTKDGLAFLEGLARRLRVLQ